MNREPSDDHSQELASPLVAGDDQDDSRPTCFLAMPVSTSDQDELVYNDPEHWAHVREFLFVPAIEAAGYTPIRPISRGTHVIHSWIIEQLAQADLVLCDFSSHNANVFFELGIRSALDLPMALVLDRRSSRPFDLGPMNSHAYDERLLHWNMRSQIHAMAQHIHDSVRTCSGANPLWRKFAVDARRPERELDPKEGRLQLIEEYLQSVNMKMEMLTRGDVPENEGSQRGLRRGVVDVIMTELNLRTFQYAIDEETTIQELLDEIYYYADGRLGLYTYSEEWTIEHLDGRPLVSLNTRSRDGSIVKDDRLILRTWLAEPWETLRFRSLKGARPS